MNENCVERDSENFFSSIYRKILVKINRSGLRFTIVAILLFAVTMNVSVGRTFDSQKHLLIEIFGHRVWCFSRAALATAISFSGNSLLLCELSRQKQFSDVSAMHARNFCPQRMLAKINFT